MKGTGPMVLAFLLAVAGCDSATGPGGRVELSFDLTQGNQGWVADFADYPVGEDEAFELTAERRPLPEGLPVDGGAFFISGRNLSDDLFMFLKRQVTDLEPGRRYALTVTVRFASRAPSGCVGIGGPPGEAVVMKAGATAVEPTPVMDEENPERPFWRMNIDKGNQSTGGEDAVVLGDIATGPGDCLDPAWKLKTLETSEPFLATTDQDGSLWLLVATDSGFEGTTALFYLRIEATLEPR